MLLFYLNSSPGVYKPLSHRRNELKKESRRHFDAMDYDFSKRDKLEKDS